MPSVRSSSRSRSDVVITKQRASVFFGTPLVAHLTQLGVQTLIICGESTSGCVRATAVDAYSHGFHVVLVEECCFDRSILSHKVNLFDMHHKYVRRDACRRGGGASRRHGVGRRAEAMPWQNSIASARRRRGGAAPDDGVASMKPAPYGPFPYSPIIHRPRLTWPDGAHVALWVIPNIEFFSLMEKVPAGSGGPGTPPPDIPTWSARDYGNRVGVFRLMQVLDRYGVRGTVALNSDLCAHHPEIIAEGKKLRLGMDGPLREQHPPPQ